MYVITYAFRRGVALIGKFFYWALLTPLWAFQVHEVYRKTALRRCRDCEEGRHVALTILL